MMHDTPSNGKLVGLGQAVMIHNVLIYIVRFGYTVHNNFVFKFYDSKRILRYLFTRP